MILLIFTIFFIICFMIILKKQKNRTALLGVYESVFIGVYIYIFIAVVIFASMFSIVDRRQNLKIQNLIIDSNHENLCYGEFETETKIFKISNIEFADENSVSVITEVRKYKNWITMLNIDPKILTFPFYEDLDGTPKWEDPHSILYVKKK